MQLCVKKGRNGKISIIATERTILFFRPWWATRNKSDGKNRGSKKFMGEQKNRGREGTRTAYPYILS